MPKRLAKVLLTATIPPWLALAYPGLHDDELDD
jgi:hypothetical protein